MRSRLGDGARLNHILDATVEIEDYIENADYDAFLNNSMMRFACIKQMEIIGEASDHISEEIKTQFSEIEWSQIKGMRNIFVHEYFGIDTRLVWEIIKHDLPDLKSKVITIINSLNEGHNRKASAFRTRTSLCTMAWIISGTWMRGAGRAAIPCW